MTSEDPKLSHQALKTKQRAIRDKFPENHGLRVHRAISWLQRAEQEVLEEDFDAAFVFYWIAFNAAYADDRGESFSPSERTHWRDYFTRIMQLDHEKLVYDAIWEQYSHSIRCLLDNHYVYEPFWKYHNQVVGYDDWQARFEKSKKKIGHALREQDTKLILLILFDRLYVLRNQLIHGGATWNSSANRDQVRDGAHIMTTLVPLFIDLMMDNPEEPWGAPFYPVV